MAGFKRKTVLNKGFQIKYAVMIGGSLLFLLAISLTFTYFTIKPLFPNILSSQYATHLKSIQLKLLLSGILYISVIVFLSVYVSHRMAGPLFRIEKDIKNLIQRDDLNFRFHIRKKDELHELVRALNKLLDHIQNRG